jgi:hypothetical protein
MAATGSGLVDTKAAGALAIFSGEDEKFNEWAFKSRAWFSLLSSSAPIGTLLDAAKNEPNEQSLDQDNYGDTAMQVSVTIFNILAQRTEGKAFKIVRSCDLGNGLLAWHRLHQEYEPSTGGRLSALLAGLLSPDWSKTTDFVATLTEWETRLTEYEIQAGEVVSSRIRAAILVRHAPPIIQAAMRSVWHDAGGDYMKLRAVVHNYVSAGKMYDGGGVRKSDDMEIGAVDKPDKGNKWDNKGGKGKNAGQGGWQKGAWQKGGNTGKNDGGKNYSKDGKGYNKGQGKSGKNDGKGKGGKDNKAPYFEGKCSFCGKQGHEEKDCWAKAR